MEVPAAVFRPLCFEGTGRDGNLIGRGADHRIDVHPIGIIRQIGIAAMGVTIAFEGGHQLLFFEALFLAIVLIGQFEAGLVADLWRDEVVEERSILNQVEMRDIVLNTLHSDWWTVNFIGRDSPGAIGCARAIRN